jgi:hypothetical protein
VSNAVVQSQDPVSGVNASPKLGEGDGAAADEWQLVHQALCDLGRRRSALDAEEVGWLREAERVRVWVPLGMASAIDYLERVLGYTPHTANERLRVARALGELPLLTSAFARGDLVFSAVRELTRVATPETEARWRDVALGRNVREIEELVAGRVRGDDPSDPPDPQAREHRVVLELRAETFARLRQARAALTAERGGYVGDDELVEQLCDALFERMDAGAGETSGRAKFQIAMQVCPACDRASQLGGGISVPVDAAALERARCDAQHLGSLDGDAPERAAQDIAPSVARFVRRRDGERCQTPGCRSSIGLELHHVIHRADGGGHDSENLRLYCSSCHAAIHRGALVIEHGPDGRVIARRPAERVVTSSGARADHGPGAATDSPVADPDGSWPAPSVDIAPTTTSGDLGAKLDAAIVRSQARDALVSMGWKPAIARTAVDEAWSHVGPRVTLEMLVREALRRCPRPR